MLGAPDVARRDSFRASGCSPCSATRARSALMASRNRRSTTSGSARRGGSGAGGALRVAPGTRRDSGGLGLSSSICETSKQTRVRFFQPADHRISASSTTMS